nr:MAG TPA: hypothetical protein [Caudoviricetes sp.]
MFYFCFIWLFLRFLYNFTLFILQTYFNFTLALGLILQIY